MHGLDYVHGELKSVRVVSDLMTSVVEEFDSSMFLSTTTTLPALRISDRRLSSRYLSLAYPKCSPPPFETTPSLCGG